MSGLECAAIFGAGIGAGAVNTVVGSGTLITFPVLLAFGYPPVLANTSNAVGLVPASISGTHGYRAQLGGQRERVPGLAAAAILGGLAGSLLLLVLPRSAFESVVPTFIAIAVVLVVAQPHLVRLGATGCRSGGAAPGLPWLAAICLVSVYGGYFGAAQGVLLLAVLGLSLDERLQRLNGIKNLLQTLVTLVAGCVFVFAGEVAWIPALLIGGGGAIGGQIGARVGQRLPSGVLRVLIVAVGTAAFIRLV